MNGQRITEAPFQSEIDNNDNSPFIISENKINLTVTCINEGLRGVYECRVLGETKQIVTKVHHLLQRPVEPETTLSPTNITPDGM